MVVTHTPETDVLVISIAALTEPPTNLYIRKENKGQAQVISIEVKQSLCLQFDSTI